MTPTRAHSLVALAFALAAPVLVSACGSSGSSKQAVPACDSSQLSASMSLRGATGGLIGGAGMKNTSASACTLTGRPPVTISVRGGRKITVVQRPWKPIWRQSLRPKPSGWPFIELKPGGEASVALRVENWCQREGSVATFGFPRPSKATFAFSLPDQRGTVSAVAVLANVCRSPRKLVDVLVGPFESAR